MTPDPMLRAIFEPADETVAELDRLHAAGAGRSRPSRSRATEQEWLRAPV